MDKMYVHINMPIEEGNLISEIKSLRPSTPPKKRDVDEPLVLSSLKKKKKEKKKDKKKKGKIPDVELMTAGEVTTVRELENSDDDNFIFVGDNLIDIDEILYGEDEDNIGDGIVDEQRKNYDKLKKEENPFKKEFAEEMTLLYNLLGDMNKFGKELEKKLKEISGSKARGSSKYYNDLIMAVLSSNTGKLHAIKEISNLKKVSLDMKLKADSKNKEMSAGEKSVERLASSYFQQVLQHGRNKFVQQFGGAGNRDDDEDEFDDIVEQIEANRQNYNDHEIDNLQAIIEQRLDSEDNPFRSENGSKYIQYENLGVTIQIKKCIDTGEWEFAALDRDNQQIFDYPLPKKKEVGKVKFSSDGRYATDERGRSYKVIEYFSPDAE